MMPVKLLIVLVMVAGLAGGCGRRGELELPGTKPAAPAADSLFGTLPGEKPADETPPSDDPIPLDILI